MHRARAFAALPLMLCAGVIASCSTVLGFEELTPAEPDAGTTDAPYEVGVDADASQPDVDATTDVAEDVIDDVSIDALDAEPDVQDAADEEAGCGDTTSNPEHCGRCNHSCFDGACVDGVCQPFKLATVADGAWGLAVDDTALYVAVLLNNEVYRFNKTSGVQLAWIPQGYGVEQPAWITVDSQNIYWSNRYTTTGSIGVCPLAGCAGPATKLIEPLNRPNGIVADGSSIFWAETEGRTVKKADADGSNIQVLVPETLNLKPLHLALHGGFVYFTERQEGRVGRVPVDGGAVQMLGQSSLPWKVAVTDDWVYWTNSEVDSGAVYRVPNEDPPDGGNTAELVAGGQNSAFGLVADDNYVYWLNSADWFVAAGALRYCPTSGCPGQPLSLDENVPYPIDLVADDEALYYTIYGIDGPLDGALRKVAKP